MKFRAKWQTEKWKDVKLQNFIFTVPCIVTLY